jgi:protein-S-isoprenylcysteine O-methyltransferase Ste14
MQKQSLYAVTIAQIFAAAVFLWIIFFRTGEWDWQRYAGAALTLTGMAGIATARFQLGNSFAIKPEARQLVTHGLYSKIRNPIYVFGAFLISGVVLILHRPRLWLFVVAIVIMQIVRAHQEARVLEKAFGESYRAYRRKTWL